MICCGKQTKWVENIPGKGYNFCGECRKEAVEAPAKPLELNPQIDLFPITEPAPEHVLIDYDTYFSSQLKTHLRVLKSYGLI